VVQVVVQHLHQGLEVLEVLEILLQQVHLKVLLAEMVYQEQETLEVVAVELVLLEEMDNYLQEQVE
jgi:hypothetical protein